MKHPLLGLALGASLVAASVLPAVAQAVPSGSYQQSCTNIRVRGDELVARCQTSNGGSVRSSIDRNSCRGGDIANVNGQLTCNGGGRGHRYGNYGRDRDDHGNRGNNGGYNNGGYNNGGYNNGNAPGGSYLQSCQNVRSNGSMITATCPTANGTMITTSINARDCRGTDISNRNGRLSCG